MVNDGTYSTFLRDAVDRMLEENAEFAIQGSYADYAINALHIASEEDQKNHGIVYKADQNVHILGGFSRAESSWGLVMPKIVVPTSPGARKSRYDIDVEDAEVRRKYSIDRGSKVTITEIQSEAKACKFLYDIQALGPRAARSEIFLKTARILASDIERAEKLQPVPIRALSQAAKNAVVS